jgi:hypothetical protein
MRHHGGMRRSVIVAVLCASALLAAGAWSSVASAKVRPFRASISELSPELRGRMSGSSWRAGCPVGLDDLRLVRVTHRTFEGKARRGNLVVHRWFAREIVRVFRKLYEERFPIRRMVLVDRYGADDMRSMKADNTSAFNCRYRNGVCCRWSMHAYGKAIDINPVENPYVGSWGVSPPNGARYRDRTPKRRGMISHGDAVWKAFRRIGWEWGGDWGWPIDYQHFSVNGR